MNIHSAQRTIDKYRTRYDTAKSQYKAETKELQTAKRHLRHVNSARKIVQTIAEEIQRQAHSQIGRVVSICLTEIFENDYQFELRFTQKANRTQANLVLMKDGNEIGDPLNQDSGGVLDVAGFAMRLSCILLQKPQSRKLLVLDEPFKNLHGHIYRERLRMLLTRLSEEFQVQIILVTGIPDFEIGRKVKLD